MDFFEYASLASFFSDTLWVKYLVGGLCFAIVYIFQAVALFIISGREGYKNRWMAFVPFLNTYYIGVCAQKNRCLGKIDTKIISLVAAVLEVLVFTGYLIDEIAFQTLINAGLVEYATEETAYGILFVTPKLVANIADFPQFFWAAWCFSYLSNYILWWAELILLFVQVLVLSSFFQTYAARRYMLFTITSVLFPIQGILFFIVRNNRGMSYRDYMRAEQEKRYRMYQQYRQNYEQNPYNQNPYSRSDSAPTGEEPYNRPQDTNATSSGGDDDPFSEFGSKGGDPFSSDDNNHVN